MKHKLIVTGMTCGGCERAVVSAVKKVEGITSARADHTTNLVEFDTVNDNVDIDTVIAYIKRVGFNVEQEG